MKRILSILILLILLVSLISCANTDNVDSESTSSTVIQDDEYDFGELDCQDGNFTFLQCDEDRWGMKTALAPTELKGMDVSDAMYKRNKNIEELYNVNILCINKDIYETGEFVRTQCMSGNQDVDAAFIIGSSVPSVMSEGCLNDIASMPNIQIYEPWWNQKIREASQFGGSSALYYAQSDISVTAFELTWCVSVNLDMITELQLEDPYKLVKDDQWTIEKMLEMSKVGMVPNADGSYDYTEATTCTLGFTTYCNFFAAGINGAECFMTTKDAIGNPVFAGEGERFLDVVAKYANAFHTPGLFVEAQQDGFHYEEVFADGRALFAGVEIKATSLFRTKEFKYGILPVPKYDVEQQSYYSNVNYLAPVLVIPNTNMDFEKTGRIIDAMAYLSYKEVLPVYYDSNLSYKSLSDPEAIEMLNIIRDTRCFDISLLYGWTTDFYLEMQAVFIGETTSINASPVIATHRGKIVKTINNYLSTLS